MDGSAVTKAPAVPREWKWVGLEFESPKDNNTACEKIWLETILSIATFLEVHPRDTTV
jgi:hypothetical protein